MSGFKKNGIIRLLNGLIIVFRPYICITDDELPEKKIMEEHFWPVGNGAVCDEIFYIFSGSILIF